MNKYLNYLNNNYFREINYIYITDETKKKHKFTKNNTTRKSSRKPT